MEGIFSKIQFHNMIIFLITLALINLQIKTRIITQIATIMTTKITIIMKVTAIAIAVVMISKINNLINK